MGVRLVFPVRGYSFSKELVSTALELLNRISIRYKKAVVLCTSSQEAYRVLNYLTECGLSTALYRTKRIYCDSLPAMKEF